MDEQRRGRSKDAEVGSPLQIKQERVRRFSFRPERVTGKKAIDTNQIYAESQS
jgi:hypothetical protein